MILYNLIIWSPFDGSINYGYFRCKSNAVLKATQRLKEGEEFIKKHYPGDDMIQEYQYHIEEIKTED